MQAPLYKSPYDIPVGTVLGMSFPQGPLNPMDFMGQEFGFDQQPLQQPMMGAMDQGYGGDMGNQSRYDENGFRRSDGRRKIRGYSNPAARPTTRGTMPFGGFRAKGGPVSPGRKYVVGEQGPEMFVPQRPGTIIPMAQRDLINLDRASQMNAEKGMADMRHRNAMRPGGSQFSGPLQPPPPNMRLMEAQKQNAIAGQNQRELAAKFNPPVPQAMPMMPADPRRSGPLSGRSQFGAQSGPLSMRGPMPVGRSANDPNRIAEQMRRRGDPRAIMQLGMQQQGMDFARERDATNFQQGLMMNDMQQAAMAQRDATNFQQGLTMFDAQQQAMGQRDATNFQQQQQLEEGRRAYEAQQSAQEAQQRQQFGLKPLQVPGTDTPYFQDFKGSIYTGAAPRQPDAPLPPGMVPQSAERGGVRYGVPENNKPAPMPKIETEGGDETLDAKGNKVRSPIRHFYFDMNPDTGRPIKRYVTDVDGDGVPDAQQPAAGGGDPAAPSWLNWMQQQQ